MSARDQEPLQSNLDRLIADFVERIALEAQIVVALQSGELRSRRNGEDDTPAAIEFHRQGAEAYRRGLEALRRVRAG